MSSPHPFHQWTPMEQPRFGTRVVEANDEFFGAKERLIKPEAPVFLPDEYDEHGKWMDGWETRRRREPGHDWCIVRLGLPGVVHGLDIDTSHFTGNYPEAASIDACYTDEEIPGADAAWRVLLPRVELTGDSHHYLPVDDREPVSHLRLNIYPDGGVARLRIYGEVRPDPGAAAPSGPVDLFALEHGGRALACSDEHFGSMHNLNVPGRGVNMGDGWETRRRRGPGHDWVVLALGRAGRIEEAEIDTAHFKGNYPARASLQAARIEGSDLDSLLKESAEWPELLPAVPLAADTVHRFRSELTDLGTVTHVRLAIDPDGGVSRLRLLGHATGPTTDHAMSAGTGRATGGAGD